MPNSTQILQSGENIFAWVMACLPLPMTEPACRPLWEFVALACGVAGVALVLWFLWRLVDYRLKYRAAIRAQAAREQVAEPEVIAQHTFREAGDVADDVTDPHLADKIRAELTRRRLDNISRPK